MDLVPAEGQETTPGHPHPDPFLPLALKNWRIGFLLDWRVTQVDDHTASVTPIQLLVPCDLVTVQQIAFSTDREGAEFVDPIPALVSELTSAVLVDHGVRLLSDDALPAQLN